MVPRLEWSKVVPELMSPAVTVLAEKCPNSEPGLEIKLLTVAEKARGTLTGEKIHLKAALKFARFVSLALD